MDYKQILEEKFGLMILDANLNFVNTDQTLEVVLNTRNLNELEKYSREIYSFLETQEWYKETWNLEVLSKGSSTNIKISEIASSIGLKVKIDLKKSLETNNSIVAEILEDREDTILVRWNKKGCLRKIEIEKNNIENIEIYF